jgi:hypothetical protein
VSDYAIYNQLQTLIKIMPEASDELEEAAERWLTSFGQKPEV